MIPEAEQVAFEAAMRQWDKSLKRRDLSDRDRVAGALLAFSRQLAAFGLHPPAGTDLKGATLYTGLSRATLYKDIRDGLLIARKKGTRTILLYDDLDAYLRALPPAKFDPFIGSKMGALARRKKP